MPTRLLLLSLAAGCSLLAGSPTIIVAIGGSMLVGLLFDRLAAAPR
jgi:hypothetical protein